MADTALTLITDTLLDMGVLANQAQPTAFQTQQALRKLNNLLESWSIEGLLVFGVTGNVLPLVAGKQVYSLGPGGDLDIPYPTNITSAFIRNTYLPSGQQQDWPLYMYNDSEWENVPFKNQAAAWPNWGIWFNSTYPLVYAYMLPVPTTSQYSVVIWTEDNFGTYTANTVLALPPGYKRALTTNLFLELAPSYSIAVDDQTRQNAAESKAVIQLKNLQINEISPNFDNPKWYDIVTNRYYYGPS